MSSGYYPAGAENDPNAPYNQPSDKDIEVEVNLNSFTFWILQYSGCVEVLPDRNTCFYLMGNEMNAEYLCNGVEGYTSICGHRNTVNHKIWKNEKGNLIMCDCGCGFQA